MHELYDNDYLITAAEAEKIIKYSAELKSGKPVQYVVGQTYFYDCIIKVNSSLLFPVQKQRSLLILLLRKQGYKGHIIDIGTGSGCIAVALAANIPSAALTGIEISEEAIRIAAENAVLNNVKISFIKGDIFNLDPEKVGKAGIIVSNPPYVRNSEKAGMAKNVVDYEPHLALFVTDSDPLIYYNAVLQLAEKVLLPQGFLYFEINEAMGSSLIRLVESFDYSDIKVILDINDKERILRGRKNG